MAHTTAASARSDTVTSVGKAIVNIGVLPTIALAALYLVYVLSTSLTGSVGDMKRSLEGHVVMTETIQKTLDGQSKILERQTSILTQSCVIAARNETQRAACLEAGR